MVIEKIFYALSLAGILSMVAPAVCFERDMAAAIAASLKTFSLENDARLARQLEQRERRYAAVRTAAVPAVTVNWLTVNRQGEDPTCAHRALFNLETCLDWVQGRSTLQERNARLLRGLPRFSEHYKYGHEMVRYLKNPKFGGFILTFFSLENLKNDVPMGIAAHETELKSLLDAIENLRRASSGTLLCLMSSGQATHYEKSKIAGNALFCVVHDEGHATGIAITKRADGSYLFEVMEPHGRGEKVGTHERVAYLVDLVVKQDLNKIRASIAEYRKIWQLQMLEDRR